MTLKSDKVNVLGQFWTVFYHPADAPLLHEEEGEVFGYADQDKRELHVSLRGDVLYNLLHEIEHIMGWLLNVNNHSGDRHDEMDTMNTGRIATLRANPWLLEALKSG